MSSAIAHAVPRRGGWPAQPKRPRTNRKLVEMRINAGLSPRRLALKAGISANGVYAAEAGRRVSPHIQKGIADVFGVDVLTIWSLEDYLP